MATFLEMQTRLLNAINRPSTEADVLLATKDAINDSIIQLQRNQGFTYAERLADFTYPASTLYVDLGTVCDGPLRDIFSLQQLNSSGEIQGKPLKIVTYNQLQAMRARYERTHKVDDTEAYDPTVVGFTIEDAYRQDMIAFVVNQYIGLYPRPNANVNLLLHCHIWFPALEDDDDTNFFLTYANDLVYMMSLKKLMIFMKNTTNFPFTKDDLDFSLKSLVAWDGQVKETPMTVLS